MIRYRQRKRLEAQPLIAGLAAAVKGPAGGVAPGSDREFREEVAPKREGLVSFKIPRGDIYGVGEVK